MNKNDFQEFGEVLEQVLDKRKHIDEVQHQKDHEFVKLQRERRKARVELWLKVRNTAIGTAVAAATVGLISFLAWIGEIIWEHAVNSGSGGGN